MNVSHDSDVGTGWHHIVASKEGNYLNIYIDGKKTDCSREFNVDNFNLTNDKPLTIGFGCLNFLNTTVDDVVIAKGTADSKTIKKMYNKTFR